MTNTMTPSEIDEVLGRYSIRTFSQAAATMIRELEARETRALAVAEHHADESMVLKAKLKIATEALEIIEGGSSYSVGALAFCAAETALARIKEVGGE